MWRLNGSTRVWIVSAPAHRSVVLCLGSSVTYSSCGMVRASLDIPRRRTARPAARRTRKLRNRCIAADARGIRAFIQPIASKRRSQSPSREAFGPLSGSEAEGAVNGLAVGGVLAASRWTAYRRGKVHAREWLPAATVIHRSVSISLLQEQVVAPTIPERGQMGQLSRSRSGAPPAHHGRGGDFSERSRHPCRDGTPPTRSYSENLLPPPR
jgi:hypothetical protein